MDFNTKAKCRKRSFKALAIAALLGLSLTGFSTGHANSANHPHLAVGNVSSSPMGWVQFCRDNPAECASRPVSQPRDILMNQPNWATIVRINRLVNEKIEPTSDMDQFGVLEYWSYPTSGKGDCEDYVLLKRKMLMDLGMPRDALLITVVRDHKGDGHAVLTVRTDRGDYILDNQADEVLPWHQTGYRFVKRQSQIDQNQWVLVGSPTPQPAAVASQR